MTDLLRKCVYLMKISNTMSSCACYVLCNYNFYSIRVIINLLFSTKILRLQSNLFTCVSWLQFETKWTLSMLNFSRFSNDKKCSYLLGYDSFGETQLLVCWKMCFHFLVWMKNSFLRILKSIYKKMGQKISIDNQYLR